ncbi:ABC transporter substrate-binding protein [Glutamicibacter sp. V16R2B1]|uniref:ABC transporter substrate-binding protein n=1 Tax=Glutamicibacter sp. V16R2B1 TaxID=2036207 RepID=UPI0010FE9F8F|nr:ABC transporter substrate-binding protein [Glutamicibacter sp. V16R2B1]TLK50972.1 amino acid ABC transporter substrate-binding protein [Glutamicibacter sp. V16R2B1]
MRTFKKNVLSTLAIGSAALIALTGCGGSDNGSSDTEGSGFTPRTAGQLTVCSDVPYEPFEFKKDGEIVGLDIDIANEIASDMDLKLSVITAGFDSIESGLFKTQCDIAMSSISITDARKANMDFSEPYLDDDLMLVARKESGITDVESAKGKRVAVQQATTGEKYGKEQGLETIGYEDSGLQLQALTSNKADAALGNQSVLRYAIADKPDFEVVQEIQTGEKLGVAVPKDSAELLDKVNSTLDRLKSSGDLDKMTDKWLGQK